MRRLPALFLGLLLALAAIVPLQAASAPGETGPSVVIFVAQLLVLMLVGRLLGEGMTT